MTFLAQLFLELWDIILSHHYDTLIDKSFISWWFRFVKFQILARFLFLSPFEGRAGPPGSSSCLTNLFWKIFKAPRWSPSTRPMIRSPRRPLLQIQWRVFLNEQNTEARRPVLLVEMIPKVESEVFAQWGNATKGFSHRKVILVSHGRREEEILSWTITLFLVKSSVRRLVGGIRSASRQDRFDPPLLPPSARSRVTCQRWRSLSLSHFCKKIWSDNCFEIVVTFKMSYCQLIPKMLQKIWWGCT